MSDDPRFIHAGTPSESEGAARERLYELFAGCPIPPDEILANLGLFLKRQELRGSCSSRSSTSGSSTWTES